jgi:hypothetical protein
VGQATCAESGRTFLLCDYIIQEHGSGKKSLIGVFHNIVAGRFPFVHPSLFLYANLSDALGEYDFEMKLVDVNSRKVIGQGKIPKIKIADRLKPVEIAMNIRQLVFPGPGKYEFQFYANGELVDSRDIWVTQGKRPPAKGGETEGKS